MVLEYDKVIGTAIAMQRRGGSFVQYLGRALAAADLENRERIKEAFPEYWEQYRAMAEKNNWYLPE